VPRAERVAAAKKDAKARPVPREELAEKIDPEVQ